MIQDYPRQVILKDGQEAILRVLRPSDEEELKAFYLRLTPEERWYLNHDITDEELVKAWCQNIDLSQSLPVVAEVNGHLVGSAALFFHKFGAYKHIGRLTVLVDPAFRRKRLGTWLMLDIINQAVNAGLERVEIRLVVGPEDEAIEGARRLDFFEAATLAGYARAPGGEPRDLKIMTKRLHPGWDDF